MSRSSMAARRGHCGAGIGQSRRRVQKVARADQGAVLGEQAVVPGPGLTGVVRARAGLAGWLRSRTVRQPGWLPRRVASPIPAAMIAPGAAWRPAVRPGPLSRARRLGARFPGP